MAGYTSGGAPYGAFEDEYGPDDALNLPAEEVPWASTPRGTAWLVDVLRLDKGGFGYCWRPKDEPVENHHIRRTVRFWSVHGLDEEVLRALAERRFDDLPRSVPEQVRRQAAEDLQASLAHLREVCSEYWEGEWRREHRGLGRYPENYLWEAVDGYLDLLDAADSPVDQPRPAAFGHIEPPGTCVRAPGCVGWRNLPVRAASGRSWCNFGHWRRFVATPEGPGRLSEQRFATDSIGVKKMGSTTMKSMKVALVGGAVAAAALLSACSGNGAAENNSAAPIKNVADTAAFKGTTQGNHAPAKGSSSSNASGAAANGDVNCSEMGGKVGLPGGPQVDLIAIASPDGTTGCTEAFNVISEYYDKVPTEGEGPGQRVLDITGGWDCAKAEEPAGSQGAVYCGKGATALRIETKPSENSTPASPPKLRFPNTTQTVQFAGFDNSTNMAQFKLMKWKSGGADGGHYVEVPGDTKTYRLPLNEHGEVFSAATICTGGDVTVDDKGFGTKPCTPLELTDALTGGTPPLAQIHVDGDDRIATVKEIYHP